MGVCMWGESLQPKAQESHSDLKWDTVSCNRCLLQRRITYRLWTGNTCMKMVGVMITGHPLSISSARATLGAWSFYSFLISVQCNAPFVCRNLKCFKYKLCFRPSILSPIQESKKFCLRVTNICLFNPHSIGADSVASPELGLWISR